MSTLDEKIARYKPIFGDVKSIEIAHLVKKRNALRSSIVTADKRVQSARRAQDKKSADEQRLEQLERQIEHML